MSAAATMNAPRAARPRAGSAPLLLPYQRRWVRDTSRLKLWEKSRRVGADYAEAAGVVESRLSGARVMDYWYSSADESAAREFVEYVRHFARAYGQAVRIVTDETVVDEQKLMVMHAELPAPDGRVSRVTAMASNPKRFRSKGGDVCLSEFAFHDDAREMYRAAQPCITWGGRLSILTTHDHDQTEFERFCQMARRASDPATHGAPRAGDIGWSHHRTTIDDAIADGLVEKINETRGTASTREEFRETLRREAGDAETWQREYLCVPSSVGGSYFPYDDLRPLVHVDDAAATDNPLILLSDVTERVRAWKPTALFAGSDVGRVADEFALVVGAKVGGRVRTAGSLAWSGRDYGAMEGAIGLLMGATFAHDESSLRVRRLCIDRSGLGMQLAERMEQKFRTRVEGVAFTAAAKEDLATRARRCVEEKTITLADDEATLAQWNSVRRTLTAQGKARYDGGTDTSHADRFWAHALMLLAADASPRGVRDVPVIAGAGGWL